MSKTHYRHIQKMAHKAYEVYVETKDKEAWKDYDALERVLEMEFPKTHVRRFYPPQQVKSFKIKAGTTLADIEAAGFMKYPTPNEKGNVLYKFMTLLDAIEVWIHIPENLDEFDDFYSVEVMDDAFGQPYTPFYGMHYKKEVTNFPALQKVIMEYNKTLERMPFLQVMKKKEIES